MLICTLHIYNNYSNYSFQSQIISIVIHHRELTLRATQLSGDVKQTSRYIYAVTHVRSCL